MAEAIADPVILMLDGEKAHLNRMRIQLAGLGHFRGLTDPREALAYVVGRPIDVALVDPATAGPAGEGLAFVADLRQHDPEVAIVLRTADPSREVADRAMEQKVFRLVGKTRSGREEMQKIVREAIQETRARRKLLRDAADGARVKEEFLRMAGSIDDYVTIGNRCRVLLYALRNLTTASAGYADLLVQAAEKARHADLRHLAGLNRKTAARLVDETRDFLRSPFFEPENPARAPLNATLAELSKTFAATPRWTDAGQNLVFEPLPSDLAVSTAPSRLFTALRHITEYCFRRVGAPTQVTARAALVPQPQLELDEVQADAMIFNRLHIPAGHPCARIRLLADLGTATLAELNAEIQRPPDDPRCGSLFIMAASLSENRHGFVLRRLPGNLTAFDIYVPTTA